MTLTLAGEPFDPLKNREDDQENWAVSMLSRAGMVPRYSYRAGANMVQLRLAPERRNPALQLLVSVLIGVLAGVLGHALIPAEVRGDIARMVLDPFQDAFLRVLNAAGGPIIFLSVLVAYSGISRQFSGHSYGRALLLRFMGISMLADLVALLISIACFQRSQLMQPVYESQVRSTLDAFLQIFPGDILSPFISGDTPQLILIALLLGNALLIVEPQAGVLTSLVERINSVGLVVAEWVSRLTPLFVILLVVLNFWNGSLEMLLDLWKPLLVFTVLCAVLLPCSLLLVCRREGMGLKLLWGKIRVSFLMALRNASVDVAFGENQMCCENELGIRSSYVSDVLPFGLVMFMPASSAATIVFTMFAADAFHTPISFLWLLTALVLSVALGAAAPPVAGVGLLTYAVIFTQLDISEAALPLAMVADILFSFLASAVNQAMLQMELILAADGLQYLDRAVLTHAPRGKSRHT